MAAFFLTAHFTQDDYPYDWLVHWLSKQRASGRSHESDNTARSVRRNGATQSTAGDVNSKPDAKIRSEKGNCKISMLEGQDIAVHNSNSTNVGGDYHEHKNTIIVLQDRYSLPDDSSELGRLGEEQLQLSEIFSRLPSLLEAKVNEPQHNKSVPGLDNANVIPGAWSDDHFDELHFNSLNDPLPVNPEDEDIIYQTSTKDNETTRSLEDCIANQDFVWVLLPYVTNYFSSWYGWLQAWSYTWIPTFRSWVWPSTPIA